MATAVRAFGRAWVLGCALALTWAGEARAQLISPTAVAVIGQEILVYNTLNQAAGDVLFYATDIARDPSQSQTRLYVADTFNSRVLGFECSAAACVVPTGASAVRLFGQPDYSWWTSNGGVSGRPSATTMSFPMGIAVGPGGMLAVADTWNNRVLIFLNAWSDATADVVLGQSSMSTISAGGAANQLRAPEGVAFDQAGALWVADTGNNRVLKFTTIQTGASAVLVLGSSGGPAPTTMAAPRGVAFAPSGELYVADSGFSRVLRFRANVGGGEGAQAVYGQGGNLSSGTANLGGVHASSLAFPEKVHVDGGGRLWVADTGNNRVLEFDAPLSSTTAQRVYGQSSRSQVPTFATNVVDAPDGFPNASGLAGPRGLLVDAANVLWVADRNNSRVLGFQSPLGGAPANIVADRVLGDTVFIDSAVNQATANRLNNPFGVAVDRSSSPNRLYVVDVGNNRILGYNSTENVTNNRAADLVLGQPSLTDSATNAGLNGPLQNAVNSIASAASLLFPSGVAVDSLGGVYVADTSNSRVLHFINPFGTDTTADRVFGQDNFSDHNPHFYYGAANGLMGPRHVAIDGANNLWVADTNYHRVVRFSNAPAKPTTGSSADLILGQSAFVSATTHPVYAPGCAPNRMNRPYGVFPGQGNRLYVADTENHRVLVFNGPFTNGMSAVAVFGQPNLSSCARNRGGAAGPSTLNEPWRVYEDAAGNVYIADYGNNRVLIYHTPFAAGDMVADEVIGQPNLQTVSVASQPGPNTLFAPADIAADAFGRWFVADCENSRVLRYPSSATISLDPLPSPVVVGEFLTVTGSGFTAGSVLKLFVATGSGVQALGPYVPQTRAPGYLITNLPPDIPLGNGFVSLQVINTDQGYAASNVQSQWLYGSAARNIPTVTAVNGVAMPAPDPSIPVAYVETTLPQGSTVTIDGTGFNAPLVNLYTSSGNVGPLSPLAGGTSTRIRVVIPGSAPTGPGSIQVINSPFTATVVSNSVAVVVGPRISITEVSQSGSTVTVDGTGFSTWTVVNLYNKQGTTAVNLGGLNANGTARVPLTFINETRFTFAVPSGAVTGPAFVEALNPPFIPHSSTGSDPDGAFSLTATAAATTASVEHDQATPGLSGAEGSAAPDGVDGARWPVGSDASRLEQVRWARVVDAATNDDAHLVQVAGDPWEAGAGSQQALLRGDGAIAWQVGAAAGDSVVGLGREDFGAGPADIEYGFGVRARTAELWVYERGRPVGLVGPLAPGDRLRISVRSGQVEFSHNDAVVWTSAIPPAYPLLVNASLGGPGSSLGPLQLSGSLGALVAWPDVPGTAAEGTRVGAVSPMTLVAADSHDAAAVSATVTGPAAIGLGSSGCDFCVARTGATIDVWHAGARLGSWPAAEPARYRVTFDPTSGVVGYWVGDTLLTEAPALPIPEKLRPAAWLGGAGSTISTAVVER